MDCGVLFPEFELEIEDEDYSPEQTVKDEEEALQEFQQYVHDIQTNQPGAAQGTQYTEEDLPDLEELAARETEDGRQFKKFQKRVAHNKDQVRKPCAKCADLKYIFLMKNGGFGKENFLKGLSCLLLRIFDVSTLCPLFKKV